MGGLVVFAAPIAAQFASGVNLVEVYATVTDRMGEPVAGLTAADFRVAEDGTPQSITAFAAGEFPLAVAIGLDRSFSMGGRDNGSPSRSRRLAPSSARCGPPIRSW